MKNIFFLLLISFSLSAQTKVIQASELIIGETYDLEKGDWTDSFKATFPTRGVIIEEQRQIGTLEYEYLFFDGVKDLVTGKKVSKGQLKKGYPKRYENIYSTKIATTPEMELYEKEVDVVDVKYDFVLPSKSRLQIKSYYTPNGVKMEYCESCLQGLTTIPPVDNLFAFDGKTTYRSEGGKWIPNVSKRDR